LHVVFCQEKLKGPVVYVIFICELLPGEDKGPEVFVSPCMFYYVLGLSLCGVSNFRPCGVVVNSVVLIVVQVERDWYITFIVANHFHPCMYVICLLMLVACMSWLCGR